MTDYEKEWRWTPFRHAINPWQRIFGLSPYGFGSAKSQIRLERLVGMLVLAAPIACFAALQSASTGNSGSRWANNLDMKVEAYSRACPKDHPIWVLLTNRSKFSVNEYLWRIDAVAKGHARLRNYTQPPSRSDQIIPPRSSVSFCEPIPVFDSEDVAEKDLVFRPGFAIAYSVVEG